METQMITFAFCTYNRADRLVQLIEAMREQQCPVPFEILAINNNSPDNTLEVLSGLTRSDGPALRYVTETQQGIVPARNRAIAESIGSHILVFMDDDEMPQPGLLQAAYDAIVNEGASCVGGKVTMDFSQNPQPKWLGEELLGFLAETNHGPDAFWIEDTSTPLWTANIAYNMDIFRKDTSLRFDIRYNREGTAVGGGSDAMLFRELVSRKTRIRYRPDMIVLHDAESWRLKRAYFLKLHYRAGLRHGQFQISNYDREIFHIPPFLVAQLLRNTLNTLTNYILFRPKTLRQAMNVAYSVGTILGYRKRKRV